MDEKQKGARHLSWMKSVMLYLILDYFFMVFHGALTLFNLTGWIFKRTRTLHLITMTVTLFSWVALGYFYGWGYCFLTDWHYQVLEKRGFTDLPHSYITFTIERLLGVSVDDQLVMTITQWVFILLILVTYGLFLQKFLAISTKQSQDRH